MIDKEIIIAVISEMDGNFKENTEFFSETRDIFTARLQSYILRFNKYLEAAVIGEIGNNTFDHNFIFKNEHPRGVYCNFSYKQDYTIIADYGMGIKNSLLPVMPSINTDLEAVETAFTKRISGRSPEQRGNGLKFVSETIIQNNWYLYFQSGSGSCSISKNGMFFNEETFFLNGCLAIINFKEGL